VLDIAGECGVGVVDEVGGKRGGSAVEVDDLVDGALGELWSVP